MVKKKNKFGGYFLFCTKSLCYEIVFCKDCMKEKMLLTEDKSGVFWSN